MKIDSLEGIQLGGITQWIRVRGADVANPVLLLMQQGPGLPIINDASRLEHLLKLEDAFTVVYWDQRGTGRSSRSLRKNSNQFDISVTRMVDDTVALLELLHDRFGGKTLVAGFSFGATFAAYAAARRPELVAALIATGMDIDLPLAEDDAYDFALGAARQRGHRRAIRQLEAIGPPPHTTMRQFSTRARWAANFGGVAANANFSSLLRALLVSLVRSPDYSPAAVVRTLRGIGASQAVPSKELVWFESSAHSPHLEEPAKFRDLLMNVRASQFAST
jgi:pimeloyl-ACP methyl ester carboxylesterase